MNNDLISREALKEDFKQRLSECNDWIENSKDRETRIRAFAVKTFIGEVIMTIDNAPTVLHDNYSMGYQDGVKKVLSERPQGEWIEVEPTEEDKEYGFDIRIVCSRCGNPDSHYEFDEYHKPKAVTYYRPHFCPYCGAKMEKRHEQHGETDQEQRG